MERAGLPRDEAAHFVGLSRSTFERRVRLGGMPKPRQISEGRVVWLRRELLDALDALPVSDLPPGPGVSNG